MSNDFIKLQTTKTCSYISSRIIFVLILICILSSLTGSETSSWSSGNWQDGLSSAASKHISQLETQADRLKKEKDQKQFQLESLEQVCIKENG